MKIVDSIDLNMQSVPTFESYVFSRSNKFMVIEACTPGEIENIVKTFSSSKSSDIPVYAVKLCISILAPNLSKYFNHFMEISVFCDKITSVYKNTGQEQCFGSFRPMSTLSIFGKIFEKIINFRLYSFFLSQKVMYCTSSSLDLEKVML